MRWNDILGFVDWISDLDKSNKQKMQMNNRTYATHKPVKKATKAVRMVDNFIGMLNDLDSMCEQLTNKSYWQKNRNVPIRTSISAETKGRIGERIVADTLSKLPREDYTTINNVLLDIGSTTSQIDHIVVSVYGIFVIETKNYSGTVYGNPKSKKWYQYLGGKKYEFYNPLMQNQGHCYALSELLTGKITDYIKPITVFSRNCKLKVGDGSDLVYLDGLLPEIRKSRQVVMTRNEMQEIVKKIQGNMCNSSYVKWSEHISKVKEKEQAI